MTHAESQDLLLDLAYGELDAERAAEVTLHVEGCAECRKEKAALEEARRMAAPLRELEEPGPGFDERILTAARAQAQLEHDGNVGQVIEVTGNVRPMGVEAARIDAHGPVKARPAERHRPRWLVRAAIGGSVAAAAALALVVSNTLEARRYARVAETRSVEYAIRVQPTAPQSPESAPRDGEAKRDKDRADSPKLGFQPPPSAVLEKEKVAQLRSPARKRAPSAGGASGVQVEGSGGDVADRLASKPATPARKAESDARGAQAPAIGAAPPAPGKSVPATSGSGQVRVAERASEASALRSGEEVAFAASPSAPAADAKSESRAVKTAAPALTAAGIEANAQQARHAGDYVLAASLYRNAADLRRRDNDPGTAAWNLAHAVECLSAAGQFDEARLVRDELARVYPSETTALSAARRALREVDPAPAAK